MDQDFNKRDERSDSLGSAVQTDARAAKRVYPLHDERSRRRYSSTSTPFQMPLPKP